MSWDVTRGRYKKNFSVYDTVFNPLTLYKESNTNNAILQNGATQKSISLEASSLLETDYAIVFPDVAPMADQVLLFNGTNYVWANGSSLSAIQNIVIVQQTPTAGQFSSIAGAMASITNASSTNPYLIYVGPGVYVEANPITITPFVCVQGCAEQQVYVEPLNNSQPLFIGSAGGTLQTVILQGSPTYGIVYNGSNSSGIFAVENVVFNVNTSLANITSANGVSRSLITGCRAGAPSNFSTGFLISSTTNQLLCLIDDFSWNPTIDTNLVTLVDASGPNTTVIISSMIVGSDVLPPIGTALSFYNGAVLFLQNSLFLGFALGFDNPNIGAGATITINAGAFRQNTQDITISSPLTTGSIGAIANINNISVNPLAVVAFVITGVNGNLAITGQLFEGTIYSQITNVSTEIEQGSNLGVIFGGAISFSGLNVTVQSGYGYLMIGTPPTDYLWYTVWATQTIAVPNNTLTYLYIDNTGTLQQTTSIPPLLTTIKIGIVYTMGGTVLIQEDVPEVAHHTATLLDQNLADIMGPLFGSGCLVTSSSGMTLNVSSGTYILSVNTFNPSAYSDITWTAFYGNGSGGWNSIVQSAITTQWDNGSGTLQNLTAGQWAKGTLYVVGQGSDQEYLFVFGQQLFTTEAIADLGVLPLQPYFFNGGNVVQIAAIVVTAGDVTLPPTRILDVRPRLGFTGSGVSSVGTISQINTGAGLTGGPITTTGTISIPNGGVTNAMLANSSLTVTAGNGLTGGGTVSLGGTTTLSAVPPGFMVITSGTSYTTPSVTTTSTLFKFTLVGGGGGGGGVNTSAQGAVGGGGAGVGILLINNLPPSTTYSLTIGAGGAGGISTTTPSTSGTATTLTINATTYTANGGVAGANYNGSNQNGGVGGTATNCTLNLTGQGGGGSHSGGTGEAGGSGGSAIGWGAGGPQIAVNGNGPNGTAYGGGGAGGHGNGPSNGGSGSSGLIFVEYFN